MKQSPPTLFLQHSIQHPIQHQIQHPMSDIFAFATYIDKLTPEDYRGFSLGFWTVITSIPVAFIAINKVIDYLCKHSTIVDFINRAFDNTILPIIHTISTPNTSQQQQQLYYNGADITSSRLHLYDISEYV